MSRRKQTARSSAVPSAARDGSTDDAPQETGSDAGTILLTFTTGVLLTARFFVPAESAALGETLWIVQLWLIVAVVWFWMSARGGHRLRRLDGLDAGLALLIGGHVLSALIVLMTEGDRRGALNMLWEWVGVGVASVLIREVVRSGRGLARLRDVLVIAAITLSGLGVWQYFVWYPSLSSELAEYEQLVAATPADREQARIAQERLRVLRRHLGPLATEGDPQAHQLLRSRVAESTEPIGRFALANTFAGLLVVGLLLAMDRLLTTRLSGGASKRIVGGIMTLGMAFCFWLTKSRTAMVGLLVGILVWGMMSWRRKPWTAGGRWVMAACGVLLLVLPLVAVLSGGLDRQVVTEAPKSLQYRLEYWTATWSVIREAPVFGVGPGNFRQAYLAHKLPGASEEILDPHNLFLDVWANGGLLALAGLVIMLLAVARHVGREDNATTADRSNGLPIWSRECRWRCGVGVAAVALAAFVELMNASGAGHWGWWLAAAWCLVSVLWPVAESRPAAKFGLTAAAMALTIHLMGAGGIAMPAILQMLVLLAAGVVGGQSGSAEMALPAESVVEGKSLPWRPMGCAALCLCLAVGCAFTSTLPVSAARSQIEMGRAAMASGGGLSVAVQSFEAAIEADPLAAEPWQELALAHLADWVHLQGADDEAFRRAVEAQTEVIGHDPHSPAGWDLLGELWWRQYGARQQTQAAEEASTAFEEAVRRYPQSSSLQAKLAQAMAAAGHPSKAGTAAERGLRLDDANRAHGHRDKYLPESTRERLEAIVRNTAAGL